MTKQLPRDDFLMQQSKFSMRAETCNEVTLYF